MFDWVLNMSFYTAKLKEIYMKTQPRIEISN